MDGWETFTAVVLNQSIKAEFLMAPGGPPELALDGARTHNIEACVVRFLSI